MKWLKWEYLVVLAPVGFWAVVVYSLNAQCKDTFSAPERLRWSIGLIAGFIALGCITKALKGMTDQMAKRTETLNKLYREWRR